MSGVAFKKTCSNCHERDLTASSYKYLSNMDDAARSRVSSERLHCAYAIANSIVNVRLRMYRVITVRFGTLCADDVRILVYLAHAQRVKPHSTQKKMCF